MISAGLGMRLPGRRCACSCEGGPRSAALPRSAPGSQRLGGGRGKRCPGAGSGSRGPRRGRAGRARRRLDRPCGGWGGFSKPQAVTSRPTRAPSRPTLGSSRPSRHRAVPPVPTVRTAAGSGPLRTPRAGMPRQNSGARVSNAATHVPARAAALKLIQQRPLRTPGSARRPSAARAAQRDRIWPKRRRAGRRPATAAMSCNRRPAKSIRREWDTGHRRATRIVRGRGWPSSIARAHGRAAASGRGGIGGAAAAGDKRAELLGAPCGAGARARFRAPRLAPWKRAARCVHGTTGAQPARQHCSPRFGRPMIACTYRVV